MTAPTPQKKPNGCAIAIVVVIGLMILGAIIGGNNHDSGSSGGGSGGTTGGYVATTDDNGISTGDSFEAEYECNDFVKDRLKSPSTAHFPQDFSTNSGSTWTVSGSVDSENSFGAALRSTFTCTMTQSGHNWTLTNLDFNDGGGGN